MDKLTSELIELMQKTIKEQTKEINTMKKERKQYNLRLSKDSLSDLKQLSIINDTSVSHEIRTAIKKHLKRK